MALKQLWKHCEATLSQTWFYWSGFHRDTLKLNDKEGKGGVGKDQLKVNSSRDVIGSSVENKKWRFGVTAFLQISYMWQQWDTLIFCCDRLFCHHLAALVVLTLFM